MAQIKIKEGNKYELKDSEHVGDLQIVTFSFLNNKRIVEASIRQFVSQFGKPTKSYKCIKNSSDRHFKVIRIK